MLKDAFVIYYSVALPLSLSLKRSRRLLSGQNPPEAASDALPQLLGNATCRKASE